MPDRVTCPAHADVMPWLWEHNKSILDELRTVVEPLAETLDAFVMQDMARGAPLSREMQTAYIQRGIPFGTPYTLLPPRFFSELDDTDAPPRLPQSEYEAQALVSAYAQRTQSAPLPGMPEGSYTSTHPERLGHLLDDLVWMAQRGIAIDPIKWSQYRQAAREQAESGRYDMDIIAVSRGNSIKGLYQYPPLAQLAHTHATGAFQEFMTMPTSALDVDGHSFGLLPVGYLFMPVGAYGPVSSEKLLRASTYMVNSAQQSLGELAHDLAQAHPEVVAKHMTRSRDGRPMDASLVSTVQEGVRSTMEAAALLMVDKVPGYDDPDQLFDALIDQGVIEMFTRAIPMGMLGPLVFAGKYFPNILLNKGDGRLALNPVIMREIKTAKHAIAVQDAAEWAIYWAASEEDRKEMQPPAATSLVCPAAMPHGALRQMNKTFQRAYCVLKV